MEKKTLLIKEAVKTGWQGMKEHLGFFLLTLVSAFVIRMVPRLIIEVVGKTVDKNAPTPQQIAIAVVLIVFALAMWVLEMIIGMGLMRIPLKIYDKQKAVFSDLFSCYPLFFKYLGGVILYILIVLGGTLLLIVPGIIWAAQYSFYPLIIIDKNVGPVTALKMSSRMTRGIKGKLLWLWLALLGINILGLCAFVVGLLITIPVTMLAGVYAYRTLSAQSQTV